MTSVERMPYRWGRVKLTLSVPIYQQDYSLSSPDLWISITDLDNSPLHLHLSAACSSGGAVVSISTHFSGGVHWDMGQASPYSQTNAA